VAMVDRYNSHVQKSLDVGFTVDALGKPEIDEGQTGNPPLRAESLVIENGN